MERDAYITNMYTQRSLQINTKNTYSILQEVFMPFFNILNWVTFLDFMLIFIHIEI